MNDQPERIAPEEEQAARLTACALGELNEEEQAELKSQLVERQPSLGEQSAAAGSSSSAEVKQLVNALRRVHRSTQLPDRSIALRVAVESKLANDANYVSRSVASPMKTSRQRVWITLAVGLSLLFVASSIPLVLWYNLSVQAPETELALVASRESEIRRLTGENSRLQAESKRVDEELATIGAPLHDGLAEVKERDKEVQLLVTPRIIIPEEQEPLAGTVTREQSGVVTNRANQAPTKNYGGYPSDQLAAGSAMPHVGRGGVTRGSGAGTYGAGEMLGDAGMGTEMYGAGGRMGMPGGMGVDAGIVVEEGRVIVGGQTLPSPHYLTDDVQYFAPGPEFKLSREAAATKAVSDLHSLSQLRRTSNANEQYVQIVENRFASVTDQPLSTFSIDVDTASYANARRFLSQNQLPPPNAIRIEEFINYFRYDYPAPKEGEPFSVNLEVAQCPWQPAHQLVRIGLKGKDIPREKRPATNVVFLLDVSGSMQDANKLPLLKQAMKLLTDQLTESDRVSIVTYAGNAGLALDTTYGESKQTIRDAIDALNANGSTNGSAGIQLAYEKAIQSFLKEGANRVILATDGDLNVGVTDDDALVELIKAQAASGVFLTVLGFGEGNLKDGKLEKLADNGNGMYAYIDSLREARKVLVEQISGSLVTIAKDVKIKVEFNPAEVAAYRLLGYENRLMSAPEFDNDAKDAGEIGAGHTVTALYEIVPSKEKEQVTSTATSLKYQRPVTPTEPPQELTAAAKSGELLTLFLRSKQPDANESTLSEFTVENKQRAFDDASLDFRFAAAVASFGMVLRNSEFRGNSSLADIEQIASSAIGSDEHGHRTEFLDLVRKASTLQSPR